MLERMWEVWLSWCKKLRARLEGRADQQEVRELRNLLEQRLPQKQTGKCDPATLAGDDKQTFDYIWQATVEANRNNVTRTAAYLELYRMCPELHWAFLAHMVSRNGGYNMTDLQGDLISRAMERGEAERYFHFFERANFLIFGDAYPQLLLYEASKDQGKPLFHLLPYFGVSVFMQVVWERFWETRDLELLTLALVVNEQSYIEHRVVHHERYKSVVESFEFVAQTFLNLTQVVLPFRGNAGQGQQGKVLLAGVAVDSFRSRAERIDTGRNLYAILFGVPEVHEGALKWAIETPHTGSRSDYWADFYTTQKPVKQWKKYHPRLQGERLRAGATLFYSPVLTDAWPDVQNPEPAGGHDWCEKPESAEEIFRVQARKDWEITKQYCKTLGMVEKAVAAETWLKWGEGNR